MGRLLADRNARIYLAGRTLSSLGDRSLLLVMAIWARSLTGSASAAGVVFAIIAVTSLVAPFTGVVVDRFPRRNVLITANAVSGGVVLLLLLVHGPGQLGIIFAVALCYGLLGDVSGAAESALYTELFSGDLLPQVNAASQTSSEMLRLVTPLIGAGLYVAVGGGAVALLDAATFAAAVVSILLLRIPQPSAAGEIASEASLLGAEAMGISDRIEPGAIAVVETPTGLLPGWWAEVTAGVRHIWQTVQLRQLFLALGATMLVVGFVETLAFQVVAIGLHRPPAFVGVLITAQGVGAICGGLTSGTLVGRVGERRLTAVGIACIAAGVLLLTAPLLPVVLIGMAVAGIGVPWILVAVMTELQRATPAELQGRAAAAASTLLGGPQAVSIATGAALVAFVDYRLLLLAVAIVTAAAAAWLATRPEVEVPIMSGDSPSPA